MEAADVREEGRGSKRETKGCEEAVCSMSDGEDAGGGMEGGTNEHGDGLYTASAGMNQARVTSRRVFKSVCSVWRCAARIGVFLSIHTGAVSESGSPAQAREPSSMVT